MKKMLVLVVLILALMVGTAPKARSMSCWDIMSVVGYSETMWGLCMLEIWLQSGQPEVPDPTTNPGGTGGGGEW